MNAFSGPIVGIFGVLAALVFIILALPLMAGIGIVPSATSTALISTRDSYNNLFAFIGLILAGGISLAAISRRV